MRLEVPDRVSTSTQPFPRRARRQQGWWVPWALLGLLVAVGLAVFAGRSLSTGDRPARPELQRVLDGLVTGPDRVAPGATAYVAGPHGVWLGSAGVADVRAGTAMPVDARMRLESVSKIYTATVVLRLAQEGRLSLGDTVERWLPGILPYGDEITVRQLLTMRSGLIDTNDLGRRPAFYLARVGDTRLRAQLNSLARRISANPALEVSPVWWIRWAAWQPLLFPPGSASHYSNVGYEVLGLIAVRAAGAPLGRLYRERIFAPLGLEDTAYDPQGPIAGPHVRGYLLASGRAPIDVTDRHVAIGAGGGLVSNAEETAAFLRALMQGKLLDHRWLVEMRGAGLWYGGQPSGCAGPAYGWSGGGNGYKTNVWVSGDGSRVAVLLLNGRAGGSAQVFADASAGAALARLYCAA